MNNIKKSKEILVVDDTPANLRLLAGILTEQGYEVRPSRSGPLALKSVQSGLPDLILLDINMPDMDGYEVCELLKADERTRHIPVIFVSALSEVFDKVRAFSAGGVDYITKPFQVEEVLARVETHLTLRELQVRLEDKNDALEQRTRELFQAMDHLRATREELRAKNEDIMSSIQYASRIQRSLLPDPHEVSIWLPDSFFLWEPRDVVGGDIYFAERFGEEMLIAVMDCTGHGVPGALISMIASSLLSKITVAFGHRDPPGILRQLSSGIRTLLRQDSPDAPSDDGLDAGICLVRPAENTLTFSGANLPLFRVQNREVRYVRGDRQSLGYKRSDPDFDFTEHEISIGNGISFYMSTDGFRDQMRRDENRRFGFRTFGRKRFATLLGEIGDLPFDQQEKRLMDAFRDHKEDMPRQDDVTVIGFGF